MRLGGVERFGELGQHPGFDPGLIREGKVDELYLYTPRCGDEGTGGAGYRLNARVIQDVPSDGQGTHHLRETKAQ
ncbi:hypothetical protein COMA2_30227 [Candidatus Nitrospira nitrificans]|uniref:Uncharacterized protein n=1 Tax=Candidatus Nitrospira nitrificans TaxID=1742973 RepID=A0A0S4LIF4_9BACT|nr:hypothetical protein COMA2_30227 [Candidatus Nitrospira nitrificans]